VGFDPELFEQLGRWRFGQWLGSPLVSMSIGVGSGGAFVGAAFGRASWQREHGRALLQPAAAGGRTVERQATVRTLVIGQAAEQAGLETIP
jgi:hypothetical protein